ncbi:MAG: NAD-dependent protein deacylase [Burkholderiales bacterium]|nr:NAD-dependent protein deacylase [Burkholderiales bacterium]
MNAPTVIAEVRALAHAARRVCVLTGAGMSAESGIPTFRDAMTGLWRRFDPEQLASEAGYRADPARVWAWYAERRDGVRAAVPNAGHVAIAEFGRRRPGVLTVVTQNVDDLHQRAGWPQTIRLHGDILADQWLQPCPRGRACDPADAPPDEPPACADCGNLVRPAVVWFGEMLPEGAIDAAEAAARGCELMLVVGTSGAVWPAAGLAGRARRSGAKVAIVNPHPSEIDDEAHWVLRGTAAGLLPRLLGDLHRDGKGDIGA